MASPMPRPRIGLVLHPRRDPMPVAEKIVRWAGSHGSDVLVAAKDAGRVPDGVRPVAEDDLARDVRRLGLREQTRERAPIHRTLRAARRGEAVDHPVALGGIGCSRATARRVTPWTPAS